MSRKEDSILNKIASAVANYPGLTGAELSLRIGIPSAYRRLSEVRKLGLVQKSGSKICDVSGKAAARWYPDDRDPDIDRGGETQNQMKRRLEGRIEALVNENQNLKKQLFEYENDMPPERQKLTDSDREFINTP